MLFTVQYTMQCTHEFKLSSPAMNDFNKATTIDEFTSHFSAHDKTTLDEIFNGLHGRNVSIITIVYIIDALGWHFISFALDGKHHDIRRHPSDNLTPASN